MLSGKDIIDGYRSLNDPAVEALDILQYFKGQENKLFLNGGSAVIGPDTGYLAGPVFDRSEIIYADINPDRIIEGRLAIDTNGHYSRPDVFHLEVNAAPRKGISFSDPAKD